MDRRSPYDLDRTLALSDGIIAFSMTLMAILVALPNPASVPSEQFLDNLLSTTVPQAVVFGYAFLIVSMYWALHNKLLRGLAVCDGGVTRINILFLLSVVLLAITSAMFGDYPSNQWAVTVFALNMAAAGLILVWLWRYVISKHYHRQRLSPKAREYALVVKLVTPAIFLLSIPVAFYSVSLAELCWLSIPLVQLWLNRYDPSQSKS
ncbi:Uncharacterised protein [uncultured archaeon]|nr:Uncharacterised protein [uncultured archaeon]